MLCGPDGELPEKLRNLEPRLIEHVSNEIMDRDPNVRWNDIGTVRFLMFDALVFLIATCILLYLKLLYFIFIDLQYCSWSGACQKMRDGDGHLAFTAS